MNQSFYRIMRLMNNAETAGALADGRLTLSAGPLDLAGLCRELYREVSDLAEAAGVSFRFDSQCGSLLTTGDSGLIRRMLLCLISNALGAAKTGGRAGLRLTEVNGRAILTVWDSGAGLDSRRKAGGAGTGLPIARQIAALHGGALMLESRPGEGLRATVSLPIQRPDRSTLRTPTQAFDGTGGFSPCWWSWPTCCPGRFSAGRAWSEIEKYGGLGAHRGPHALFCLDKPVQLLLNPDIARFLLPLQAGQLGAEPGYSLLGLVSIAPGPVPLSPLLSPLSLFYSPCSPAAAQAFPDFRGRCRKIYSAGQA